MTDPTVDELVGRTRALRVRAAVLGMAAAVFSGAVPFTPSSFQWVPLTGLGAAALGTIWAGWSMARTSLSASVAKRIAWWPWMEGGTAPMASLAGLESVWKTSGHPVHAVWGTPVSGKGRKSSWLWAPVSWPVPDAEPDAQGAVQQVQAWALHMVWTAGPALGRVRRAGARGPGRGWSPVAFAHPAMASWRIHARDAVQTTRVWSPVAVERWLDVPVDPRLALDGWASGALCVVPAEWIEGADPRPMAALVAALRAAVGPARWDAAVGDAWCPVPCRAGAPAQPKDSVPSDGQHMPQSNTKGVL